MAKRIAATEVHEQHQRIGPLLSEPARTFWTVHCKAHGSLWQHRSKLTTEGEALRLARRVRDAGQINPAHWVELGSWAAYMEAPPEEPDYDWAAENQDLVARWACYR